MIFDELRAAVKANDDWPTEESKANVIHYARRFVDAVDQRAVMIAHMRAHTTPSEQALSEIMDGGAG